MIEVRQIEGHPDDLRAVADILKIRDVGNEFGDLRDADERLLLEWVNAWHKYGEKDGRPYGLWGGFSENGLLTSIVLLHWAKEANCSLAYATASDSREQGVATETVGRILLKVGERHPGLTLQAVVKVNNPASCRVLENSASPVSEPSEL